MAGSTSGGSSSNCSGTGIQLMDVIDIEHLYKAYGSLSVLRNLSLQVKQGEIYALLGAHGVGKSTLLHILLGFLKPSSGKVQVLGTPDLDIARQQIGYIPERMSYHMRYSAREYLSFLGRFSDLHGRVLRVQVDEQLRRVGLYDAADQAVSSFSKSMLQRLGIAQALLVDPALLLIDEPLSVLDTAEQRHVTDLLSEVRDQGCTILICSHYVPGLIHLCDRLGVLAGGYIVDEADVQKVRTTSSRVKIQVDHLPPMLCSQLTAISGAIECTNYTIILCPNTQELQAHVLRMLLDAKISILSLEPLEHPLEHFYLQAIKRVLPMPRRTRVDRTENVGEQELDAQDAAIPEYQDTDDPLLNSLLLDTQNKEYRRSISND